MSWKREEIADHKFDLIDVDEFTDESMLRKIAYSSVFIFALKDILVYMADLGSVSILVASNKDAIFNPQPNQTIIFSTVDNGLSSQNSVINNLGGPRVILALIVASLFASFVLLAFEWRKAQKIIKSRDISYAFTSEVTYSYYTIRSYPHYCFFSHIQNSRKTVDVLAFWIGWKRLILAESPRQFLNALILIDLYRSNLDEVNRLNGGMNYFAALQRMFGPRSSTDVLVFISLQLVSLTIWVISFMGIVVAFFIYIPLLCTIRGNLKEYCVHKVDKRIGEILKRKSRKRRQDIRRQEQDQIEGSTATLAQPTLPIIDIDLDSNFSLPFVYQNYEQSHANSSSSYYPAHSQHSSQRNQQQQQQYARYEHYTGPYSRSPTRRDSEHNSGF